MLGEPNIVGELVGAANMVGELGGELNGCGELGGSCGVYMVGELGGAGCIPIPFGDADI